MFRILSTVLLLFAGAFLVLQAAELPRAAGSLEVRTWEGEQWRLDQLKGKVVVVMFMSTSCPSCHAATQALKAIYEESKKRGLEVIGIATNRQAKTEMRSFVQRFEPNFPVTVGTRALWAQFGGFSVMARPPFYPHMLIVDRSGTIREEHTGRERNYYSYTNLRRLLEQYLQEPAS